MNPQQIASFRPESGFARTDIAPWRTKTTDPTTDGRITLHPALSLTSSSPESGLIREDPADGHQNLETTLSDLVAQPDSGVAYFPRATSWHPKASALSQPSNYRDLDKGTQRMLLAKLFGNIMRFPLFEDSRRGERIVLKSIREHWDEINDHKVSLDVASNRLICQTVFAWLRAIEGDAAGQVLIVLFPPPGSATAATPSPSSENAVETTPGNTTAQDLNLYDRVDYYLGEYRYIYKDMENKRGVYQSGMIAKPYARYLKIVEGLDPNEYRVNGGALRFVANAVDRAFIRWQKSWLTRNVTAKPPALRFPGTWHSSSINRGLKEGNWNRIVAAALARISNST